MAEGELLSRVRRLYENYLEQVKEVERTRRFGEGLLGFGTSTANHPCHDEFAREAEKLLEEFSAQRPESSAVRAVLEFIFFEPLEHIDGKSAYWMLLAVHGMTYRLIRRLEPADAEALWAEYRKAYPRRVRLPAQENVLEALDAGRRS